VWRIHYEVRYEWDPGKVTTHVGMWHPTEKLAMWSAERTMRGTGFWYTAVAIECSPTRTEGPRPLVSTLHRDTGEDEPDWCPDVRPSL
jgi:hypothetical protein